MRVAESRHRKSEVKTLGRGYPDSLQVFRMPASKNWYVGMYLPSKGRFVKQSTRCEKLSDAKKFAADWHEDRIVEKKTQHASRGMSFATYSEKFQETQGREIRRGNLSQNMFNEDKRKLDKDVLAYLGSY